MCEERLGEREGARPYRSADAPAFSPNHQRWS